MKQVRKHTLLLFAWLPLLLLADELRLDSGNSSLSFPSAPGKGYTVCLLADGERHLPINAPNALTLEVNGETLTGNYSSVKREGENIVCNAQLKTAHGTRFAIKDIYSTNESNLFTVSREVLISHCDARDQYFNSYFGWEIESATSLHDYEFFVPGIWYKDNLCLRPQAMASDYTDNYFYFREDRLPLPVVAAKHKQSGKTMTLLHADARPESFYGENGLHRIVDPRMQFGSLGFVCHDDLSIQFVFPGIEGEKSYVGRLPNQNKYFAYRSHPVASDIRHSYTLRFGLSHSESFPAMVETTWKRAWKEYNPPVHKMDVKDAYVESIKVLDAYLENINGAPGWPFAVYLPNGVARAYNYQMGFIGFQISNAYFLLRYGLEYDNESYIRRACEVIDFWMADSMTERGLPRLWTDAYVDRKHTWRDYETYLRSVGGGMEGLMGAWSTMKRHGIDKSDWLNYAKRFGDWLVSNQQPDGSFFIRYRWETGEPNHDSKYTTTNIIRFLIELYKATADEQYLATALRAGDFSYDFIHNDYLYVGGVIDNPNVKDRESGQMAIYAFLALYDATGDDKWKEATIQSARYTETFMFAYDVPLSLGDSLTDFPRHRDITGQTLIATGHSGIDNGLSFSSFQYYRLYLMTRDDHFLHVAKVIQNNTLQLMDLDGRMGYRWRGLVTECFNPQANRGHSVRQQLPWNQAAVLEPMHRFMDAFGEYDIEVIEQWPWEKRLQLMEQYAKTQGM
ncbi:hypothetical protein LJC35_04575 [Parabacteroides sp. OttesenSCG-928-N08]|nr:hypothetical protein [Parabacteroides sp. OttesenSCG-928-N08]